METGISSYSFSRLVHKGALTQLDVIAEAKKLGFDHIEFSKFQLPDFESPIEFAPKVKDACDKQAMKISSYTIPADFINGCGGDTAAEIERVKGEVDVAAILGVPCMRHDATQGFPAEKRVGRSFDDALPILSEAIREVTIYAETKGILTLVENHGFFCQDPHPMYAICMRKIFTSKPAVT